MELATIDAYLAVSRLFGPRAGFAMQHLGDTVDEDWKPYHEWFAAFPRGRGLRVRVRVESKAAGPEVDGNGDGEKGEKGPVEELL